MDHSPFDKEMEKPSELDTLKEAFSQAQKQIEELKAQVEASKIYKFGIERFSTDNDSIKFYTCFISYDHPSKFFEFIGPSAERMTYVYADTTKQSRPSVHSMLLIDESFLFLVRLRLGLFEQDLANRFNISVASVSRKVTTWANYLYFVLGVQPIWASREDVDLNMPKSFKDPYPRTRVILDCTEIFMQTPSSLLLQSQLYSSYKSHTTLKGLVGISPHGAVTFVSALFTGSISDKEITRCSGILDLLEKEDVVMADKGFDIEGFLVSKGVRLNIPPFLEKKSQFSISEVEETKAIASCRIHVERAIRRIKEFHIFDSPLLLNMLGTIPQLYTISCLLTNFQGPLIKKTSNTD